MSRIRITDAEVEELASTCLALTKAMCKSLSMYGVPVTTDVVKALSTSITTSLIADKLASLKSSSNYLH
jgi:hypothetical protein